MSGINYFAKFLQVTSILLCLIFLLTVGNLKTEAATFTTSTYSCSVPLTRTNWDTQITAGLSSCALQKFDSALGTLTQVNLYMYGDIVSEVGMENRDTAPQTITANVSANITFRRPNNSQLLVLLPTVSYSEDFPANDGVDDFDGVSGTTIPDLNASDSDTVLLTDPADLTTFTNSAPGAVETVGLRATATGISNYSASANYAGYVDTFALVNAQVSYQYTAHDLGITTTLPTTIIPVQNTTLNIGIVNNESVPTTGTTTITLTLPSNTQFISVSNPGWTGNLSGNILTLTNPNPIPSGTQSLDVVVNFDDSGTNFAVQGSISGVQYDYAQNNNVASTNSTLVPQTNTTPPQGQVLGVNEVISPAPSTTLFRTGGQNQAIIIITTTLLFVLLGTVIGLITYKNLEEELADDKMEV